MRILIVNFKALAANSTALQTRPRVARPLAAPVTLPGLVLGEPRCANTNPTSQNLQPQNLFSCEDPRTPSVSREDRKGFCQEKSNTIDEKRKLAKRKATRIEQKERKRTVVVGDFCFWRGERPDGSGERKSPGSSTVFCTGPSSGFPADNHAIRSDRSRLKRIPFRSEA